MVLIAAYLILNAGIILVMTAWQRYSSTLPQPPGISVPAITSPAIASPETVLRKTNVMNPQHHQRGSGVSPQTSVFICSVTVTHNPPPPSFILLFLPFDIKLQFLPPLLFEDFAARFQLCMFSFV